MLCGRPTTRQPDNLITLRDAIRDKDIALIAQLRLGQEDDRSEVVRQADLLAGVVDAVSVTDNPHGTIHMSGLAAASLLLERGIDPVLQIGARDRNRVALKSDLLGAAAIGVTSFIMRRGDKLPKDRKPKLRQFFDTGPKFLVTLARELSDFQATKGLPDLYVGARVKLFRPSDDWDAVEINRKVDFGANFIETQACLDIDLLRSYMSILVAQKVTWRCQVIVSVPVVTNVDAAQWLIENTRGATIPGDFVRAIADAEDPRRFGVEYAAQMIRAVREIPGISGIHLSTTGDVDAIVAAVDHAGECSAGPSSPGGT